MRVEPIENKKDIEKLKRYFRNKGKTRDLTLITLGLNTGFRIEDILKLRVKDVYKKREINIKESKTGKRIRKPINDSLKEILDIYCKDKPTNEYLFKSQKGENEAISTTQAYRIIKKASKACRIKLNIGTHSMRKTHGLHIFKDKGIEVAQRALNHANQIDTLTYIGVVQKQADNAIMKLNL
ncbi:tyrosine-type recombinase/integrase [Clostridioides sp. ZZV14-6387]|uniref:tyrosine-type recombinase/integrase n=1 Tax=Clostridioides sp. ZZV14-6387 TaxID=2811497 RepID=UPI001A2E97E0|nr:site-specific integrase [Clostridioides difficile]MCC0693850.1 tyrosine-type recombinase/integrase [Clostridioides sp. ZZV14-6387]EGT4533337.1 site-specific integrase [Clostridioides difficile]EJA6616438.1 tyrosine-type recombinase/integrase [Clostridioides difficile]MBH7252575.1 tyrosine-type recombinase/integrase [Clostridioides difficile]